MSTSTTIVTPVTNPSDSLITYDIKVGPNLPSPNLPTLTDSNTSSPHQTTFNPSPSIQDPSVIDFEPNTPHDTIDDKMYP